MTISRTVIIFVIVTIVVPIVIANTVSAHQNKKEGWRDDDHQCGDHLTWVFINKTLIVEGNGTMWDFDYDSYPPWRDQSNEIERIIIKEGVTSIGTLAFSKFSLLTNVSIPRSLTSIGSWAFEYCRLKEISIPENVVLIGDGAFGFCANLMSITVDDKNTRFKSIDGVLFSKGGDILIRLPQGLSDTFTIPDHVTSIGDGAFVGCTFSTFTIPNTVTSIGSQAFSGCNSLVSIDIPESVTWIGDNAFLYCVSLSHITILGTITSIEPGTFCSCKSLDNVTLPNTIISIRDYAFLDCESLKQITIPDGVTSIGECAFSTSGLVTVTIPDSVSSIEENAFEKCFDLVTVFYQGSFYIQKSLFNSCENLTNVCVSPDYNYTQFGGIDVTSSNKTCHEFQKMFNHCFKASYVDGVYVRDKKKLSAIEWEKRTNNCLVYQCINESGLVAWTNCNSTDDLNQFCIDNKCVQNKEYKKTFVEFEIEEGVKVINMNEDQILETIQIHCGVDINEMMVGYENDEQGNLLRIMIYVDDEQTAKIIADGVRVIEQEC